MATFYEVLSCSPTASQEELRRAYRGLLRKYHPDSAEQQPGTDIDAGPDGPVTEPIPDAAQRLREVREAWLVLGDPAKRRNYDRELAAEAMKASAARGFSVAPPAGSRAMTTAHDEDLVPVGSGPMIMSLVVAGALVVVLTFTFVVSGIASARLDRNQDPDDLTAQCLGGETLESLVPCTGPHNARIVADLAVVANCPSTSTERFISGRDHAICIEDPN